MRTFNAKLFFAFFGFGMSLCSAGYAQQGQERQDFMLFLHALAQASCQQDVPAPTLLAEPRFTQGRSNKVFFRLPALDKLPVPVDSVKDQFVVTIATNPANADTLDFPRPVALGADSLYVETMNGLDEGSRYNYSTILYLPVCKVDCDAVTDTSDLELHCSPYATSVWSIQDETPPQVSRVGVPELLDSPAATWLNRARFTVEADIVDPAGVWKGALYRRVCGSAAWQTAIADTVFPGSLGEDGYVFDTQPSVRFKQNLADGCYEFRIEGIDGTHTPESSANQFELAGNGGPPTAQIGAQALIRIDTTPPTAVSLSCTQQQNRMRLTWTPAADGFGIGLAAYDLLRDGQLLQHLSPETVSYVDTIPPETPDTVYTYQVKPIDSLGNVQTLGGTETCDYSSFPEVSMVPEPEFTAGTSNLVCWRGSPQIASYTIFIALENDFGSVEQHDIIDTCFTFNSLQDGAMYAYWVEAEDRQQRMVFSDTVRSVQDASLPAVVSLDVPAKVRINGRNWVKDKDIELHVTARDSEPGLINAVEIYENGLLVRKVQPGAATAAMDTVLFLQLHEQTCDVIELTARVFDAAGNQGESQVLPVHLDDLPPEPVSRFECAQLQQVNGIELTWSATFDQSECSGLAGYVLLRDEVAIDTVGPQVSTFQDTLPVETLSSRFVYEIHPYDSVGNVQTQGGSAACEYVGPASIVIQEMAEFTGGLSNKACWTVSGGLVSLTVFIDRDCDSVADDSVLIEQPTTAESCQDFSSLEDGRTYCYWVEGADAQQRKVRSDVVMSAQDATPPVIDSFSFPAGERLNAQLWAYDRQISLSVIAHDFHNGEVWDYVVTEHGQPAQRFTFADSVTQIETSVGYRIAGPNTKVELELAVVDGAGNSSAAQSLSLLLQEELAPMIAFPNPFNPLEKTITIRLQSQNETEVNIYDFFGNLVRKLVSKASSRDFVWDGRNGNGMLVTNGGYLCVGKVTQARFKIGVMKQNR